MEIKIWKFIFQSCICSKHKWTFFAQDVCAVLGSTTMYSSYAVLGSTTVYSSYAVLGSTTMYSSYAVLWQYHNVQ